MLQLVLGARADDQQPYRERRVAAAEDDVRPWGDVEQVRRESADRQGSGGSPERSAPPGQPGALRSHRRTPYLIEIGGRHRNPRRVVVGVGVLRTRLRL